MSLPIAIGEATVSSRLAAPPDPIEEYSIDGGVLSPSSRGFDPIVFVASTPSMQAIVTLSYYEMLDDSEQRDNWTAELKVQVVPSTEPISKAYRDTLHRFVLPNTAEPRPCTTLSQPIGVFSANGRYLACLIPHPESDESSVVIFQLRTPKPRTTKPPPLPSYIVSHPPPKTTSVVATNPTMLKAVNNVTCICDAYISGMDYSILLMGCRDGRLLGASYRPCVLLDLRLEGPDLSSIWYLDYRLSEGTDWLGQLVAVSGDCSCVVYKAFADARDTPDSEWTKVGVQSECSSMHATTLMRDSLCLSFVFTHKIDENDIVMGVKWIDESHVATIQKPNEKCTVKVFGIHNHGKSGMLSSLSIDENALESSHAVFPVQGNDAGHQRSLFPLSLEYDPCSDCLACGAFIRAHSERVLPFVSIWSWRSNTQGFTARGQNNCRFGSKLLTKLLIARSPQGAPEFALFTVSEDTEGNQLRIRKFSYGLAMLSPSNSAVSHNKLRPSCSLLLSADTVASPRASKTSLLSNFELQWREHKIPYDYESAFGAPRIAVVGSAQCRSIAVASSRGLCVLDCSERIYSRNYDLTMALNGRSRWARFANEVDERSFRVVSMAWWEGSASTRTRREGPLGNDDLLVAVIEVLGEDTSGGFYLSCWSQKSLNRAGQLLFPMSSPHSDPTGHREWGEPLPEHFEPGSIEILARPDSLGTNGTISSLSKACALIVDKSYSTMYRVYQLHLVRDETRSEVSNHVVCAHCCASSKIGTPADLFLASASYDFSFLNWLEEPADEMLSGNDATIGVIRKTGGGVDCFLVSASNVIAFGQVVIPADIEASEVARFWLADVVTEYDHKAQFVWAFQTMDGHLFTWTLPCYMSNEGSSEFYLSPLHCDISRAVNEKSALLGTVSRVGSMASWMQQSHRGARSDFILSSVPLSEFGCVVGVGQSKRRQRLLNPVDSDSNRAKISNILCPSDFVLHPPCCLHSLYGHVLVASDKSSSEPTLEIDRLARHLGNRMRGRRNQDTTLLALQLMMIRVVEKTAMVTQFRRDGGARHSSTVLATLLNVVRRCTTPLQFVALVSRVGRQLEPSCLSSLFPLPRPTIDSKPEKPEQLFNRSLGSGSIGLSVSTLPLLTSEDTTRRGCSYVVSHCLSELDMAFGLSDLVGRREELETAGQVFRYSCKLDDAASVSELSFDDDTESRRTSYSILCGVPNLVGRLTPTRPKSIGPVLVNGVTESKLGQVEVSRNINVLQTWDVESQGKFETATAAVGRYILSSLLVVEDLRVETRWYKVAALAAILVGDGSLSVHRCSKKEFADMANQMPVTRFTALVPLPFRRNGGLLRFFKDCIASCSIGTVQAGNLFDLLLVLLGNRDDLLETDIPGLILIAVVSGNAANRIDELLPDDPSPGPPWTAFLEAAFDL